MRHTLFPLLVLWLAFGLRLYRLDFQSIWWDEGHSIFVASHSISQIPTLPAMDVHPSAYFALLHGWMAVAGPSEFALRYLSVSFSLLTVALLWGFGRALSPNRPGTPLLSSMQSVASTNSNGPLLRCQGLPLLVALLAALSPLYVAYAQEVRSYTMITFLALAGTFMQWHLLFAPAGQGRSGKRHRLLATYIVVTAATLYTHYFTVFLLLFQNLVWLGWVWLTIPKQQPSESGSGSGRSRAAWLGLWISSQIGILFLFAPQLLLALRQVTGYTNPNLVPPSLTYFLSRSWQAYTVGLTLDPSLARWGMGIIAGVLAIGWLAQFWVRPAKPMLHFFFLVLWLLIPLAGYFIVLQRQPSFEPRYMILVTPALFLLLALAFTPSPAFRSHVQPHASRFTQHVLPYLAIMPIVIFIIGLHGYYTDETYFKDDSAAVARWLAAETTANDLVYIDVPHPFHYYVERAGIVAPTRYLFVDIHTAADILNREAAGRERLFWVTWRGSDTDPRGVIPFLAEKAGGPAGQIDFRGYRVEWFDLSQPVHFSLPAELEPAAATFGDVLRLDGFAYGGLGDTTTTTVAKPAWATLHFTLLRDTVVDYRVSLRLRAEDGHSVAQIDKDLLNDRHVRTSAWPLPDPALNQALNVYMLPMAPDTPPGSYRLELVVYNAEPPYPGEGVSGHESRDGVAAVLGYLTIIP